MRHSWARDPLFVLLAVILVAACGSPAGAELTPKETLGKLLFFDTDLSTPFGQACAACHAPETAFVGPVSEINAHGAVYPGAVHVRFGNRKPPTAAYASFSPDFYYDEDEGLYIGGSFWDGRALNIVEQAKGPFLNPLEQNNPNRKVVITKIQNSDYAVLFQEVYGWGSLMDPNTAYDYVADAIAAYESSEEVNQFSSKYDAYLAGMAELTEQEMRGLMLFEGEAMCSACHPSEPGVNGEPPLFTDFTYDNLGMPKNPENPFYEMPPKWNPDGADWIDYGLGGRLGLQEEMGKFKVPTLRNVGMRPYEGFVQAYGHNGVFKSLHEIVDFYNTRDVGDWPPPEVPENINTEELGNLGLSDEDVDDIVAFLNTLTDGYMEGGPGLGREVVLIPTPSLEPVQEVIPAGSHPNPFRSFTEIRFDLPEAGAVRLAVYDPSGRRVRSLLAGDAVAAGSHGVVWNGSDDAGRAVPAGVYFYRLEAGSEQTVKRIVRIR